MAVLKIGGVDFAPYVEQGGIAWKRNDLEAPDAGRSTMDGLMHRARVVSKVTLEVSCIPIDTATAARLLNALYPQYVQVEYEDPQEGLTTKTMYSNNVSLSERLAYQDGRRLWEGLRFPLIER